MSQFTVKRDRKFQELGKRFNQLKKSMARISVDASRTHAEGVRDSTIEGLRKSNLVRPSLAASTVDEKSFRGYSRVRTPLMGRGSMISGLRIRKVSKGYRVAPYGTHSSGMSMAQMWAIHEYGATIRITAEMKKKYVRYLAATGRLNGAPSGTGKAVRVIPARRPLQQGARRYIRSALKRQADNETRTRMSTILKTGRDPGGATGL